METKTKTKNRDKYHFIANLALFFFAIASGAYYLASVNDLAIKGFVMSDLRRDLVAEKDVNSAMEMEIMKLKSLDHISRRAERFQLVRVDRVDYVKAAPSSVAKR